MLGYDFELSTKREKNIVADTPLRKKDDTNGLLCVISIPQFD